MRAAVFHAHRNTVTERIKAGVSTSSRATTAVLELIESHFSD
jgi:hypothetical protein